MENGMFGFPLGKTTTLPKQTSIGYGQTWQDVTASRTPGTTYYNLTGRPIMAIVTNLHAVNQTTTYIVNGVTIGQSSWESFASGGIQHEGVMLIPPGSSYSITTGGTYISWVELR